jgi:two-component system LytT family response regulator
MLRTILIDDEPGSLATLEQLVRHFCPEVEIVGAFNDPRRGLEAILAQMPDLLLLDIEMPELSGFDILEKIRGTVSPKVVFTTAHNEYALKAFKYAALHFLQKPVGAAELREAVERCKQQASAQQNQMLLDLLLNNHRNHATEPPTLALPTQEGYVFVKPDDIVRCEADGGYTKFYLQGRETVLVSHTLGEFEDILADHRCYRVHDKHIVNLRFVKKYVRGDDGAVVLADNSVVEVSRRRREGFLKKMQG